MAEHGKVEYAMAEGNDLPEHEKSYSNFVHFIYVGLCHVVNILLGLAVGGLHGDWFVALAIFIIATIAAVINLANGGKALSAAVVVFSLITLGATTTT